jgi:hypothetical protein
MSSVKRVANSPAEKAPDLKKPDKKPEPEQKMKPTQSQASKEQGAAAASGSLVKFEVVSINGAPFYGTLAEIEIIHVWEKVLGRCRTEIFAMSYNRTLTRNFKVTFKLTSQALSGNIYPEPTFEYHRKKPGTETDEFDVLVCRFIGYTNVKPAEIGSLARVTVKTNDFTIEPKDVMAWLAKFGSVCVEVDYEKNSLGIRTDVLVFEVVLKKHIPEFLPISGRKVLINYPGIPRECNNCYRTGHLRRNCKTKKRDWIERVDELRRSGDFEDELFGGWLTILAQK